MPGVGLVGFVGAGFCGHFLVFWLGVVDCGRW